MIEAIATTIAIKTMIAVDIHKRLKNIAKDSRLLPDITPAPTTMPKLRTTQKLLSKTSLYENYS